MAAAMFLAKVLLCVWLGRGSIGAMIVFLIVAAWDIYGLWVLLAKESGQLFSSSQGTSSDRANFESPSRQGLARLVTKRRTKYPSAERHFVSYPETC